VTYRYSQNPAPTRKEKRKKKRNSPMITRDSSEYLLQKLIASEEVQIKLFDNCNLLSCKGGAT
jgi:hypothetical protein